jgi:hypothetical protein
MRFVKSYRRFGGPGFICTSEELAQAVERGQCGCLACGSLALDNKVGKPCIACSSAGTVHTFRRLSATCCVWTEEGQ